MNQLLVLFENLSQNRSELNIYNFVEACYISYYERTLQFARSRGASYPKDITQEVFRKLHQALLNSSTLNFSSEAALRSYLFNAVTTLCYSEYHQRSRTVSVEENTGSNRNWNPYPLINLTMDLESSCQLLGTTANCLKCLEENSLF